MKTRNVFFLALLPLMLSAQALRDVAPLKYWPAPLYWQPSHEETRSATRPEIFGVAKDKAFAQPPAQTPANSLVFIGMTPCRLVDTRVGFGFTGAFGPPSLVGGATRAFPLQTSSTCGIPNTAQAYSLNFTVVPPGPINYMTVWPVGVAQPNASTLNDTLGGVMANAATIPAGNDAGSGSVNVFVTNNTDLIIDINGYYAPQSGITLAQGTVSAPSLSFAGDPGTGIYSSTGVVNISSGGKLALSVGSATQDTAVGLSALGVNKTGTENTAVGAQALFSNLEGSDNTALGFQALFSNIGGLVLQRVVTVPFGYGNTAVGTQALYSNAGGSSNTAVGFQALHSNAGNPVLLDATGNVAIGVGALYSNASGNNNIGIGGFAAGNVSGGNSNNIHIGNQGTSVDNGTIRIGSGGVQTSLYLAGVRGTPTLAADGVPVLIDSLGQLGTSNSSARFKEDVQDMADASDGLLRLRPVTYRYKQPYADGSKPIDYGLIAEEVAEVYPDLVVRGADGQIETVQYQKLIPMLLNEAQKQEVKQREEIAEQREENRKLEARLAAVEALLEGAGAKR